jgi:hypothetical protein
MSPLKVQITPHNLRMYLPFALYLSSSQAAKTIEAHEKTIISSKALTAVAVDFIRKPEFRVKVKNYFSG